MSANPNPKPGPVFSKFLTNIGSFLQDFQAKVSQEYGLLNVFLIVRFLVLGYVFLRFEWLDNPETGNGSLPYFVPLLLLYLFGLLAFVALRKFKLNLFYDPFYLFYQVVLDIIFFSVLYWWGNATHPDLYLFYLIPLLIAARYFRMTTNLGLVTVVLAIMIGKSLTLANHGVSVLPLLPFPIQLRYGLIAGILLLRFVFSDYLKLLDGTKRLTRGQVGWDNQTDLHPALSDLVYNTSPDRAVQLLEETNRRLNKSVSHNELLEEATKLAYTKLNCESAAIFILEGGRAVRKRVLGIEPDKLTPESYGPGEGLTGRALEWNSDGQALIGKPYCNNKADKTSAIIHQNLLRYLLLLTSGQVRHLLVVPIVSSGVVVGLLRVLNKKMPYEGDSTQLDKSGFTATDVSTLSIIASLVAAALQQKVNLGRLEHLNRISSKLESRFEQEQAIYDYAIEQIITLFSCEDCSFFINDEFEERLRLQASYRVPTTDTRIWSESRPIVATPKAGLTAWVACTKEPLMFSGEDYRNHKAYRGFDYHYTHLPAQTCYGMMIIPMVDSTGRCTGVFRIINKHGPAGKSSFTTEDFELAQILASQLANVVRRERLYQRKEQQTRTSTTMVQLGQELIWRQLEIPEAFQKVADTARSLFGADLVGIFQYNDTATGVSPTFQRTGLTFSGQRLSHEILQPPRPGGLTQRTAAHTDGYIVVEIAKEQKKTAFLVKEEINCLLSVSLKAENESFGVLSIYHRQPHTFTPEEISQVLLIANLISASIKVSKAGEVRDFKVKISSQVERIRRQTLSGEISHIVAKIREVVQTIHSFEQVFIFIEKEYLPLASQTSSDLEAAQERNFEWTRVAIRGLNKHGIGYIRAGCIPAKCGSLSNAQETALSHLGDRVGLLLEELKLMQDLLEQRQTLDNMTDYLSHFSHELRAPTTRAMNNLNNLINGRIKEAEQIKRMQTTYDDLARQLKLIERMFKMKKLENTRLSFLPTDLVALVDEVVDENSDWTRNKGVTLVNPSSGVLPLIQADPDFIKDVLNNLVVNAISFTPAEGSVVISFGRRANKVFVRVRDTGPGMTEEVRNRVFEKFYQGHDWQQRQDKGLGLGLFYAKKFAQMHEGDIFVESTPGLGSCFTMELPLDAMVIADAD